MFPETTDFSRCVVHNYATMRLFMAYSIWERFHGSLYLDWSDCEELAHQTFEGKTAEIEQALESIYSEDRQTAFETYNECYDMELGNPNYCWIVLFLVN